MDTSSETGRAGHTGDGADAEPDRAPGETAQVTPVAGAPSDNTTLTAILSTLDEDGFGAQFVVRDGAQVECVTCGNVSAADRFTPRRSRRLEGASDPDDLVNVIATTCPVCSVGGTIVLGYGVNASPDDGDVSAAMDFRGVSIQVPTDVALADET